MHRFWERLLRYLSTALACLCVVQLGTWLPFYLTWPWFADHDVFATMAQGWDAGLLPYRDLIGNNFPGTIYLFWCLGKVFGWGCVPALYAVDAALLVLFGGMLVHWGRVRFGRALPGVAGYLLILSYYLTLDFSQTAQRDWHAPLLVVLGLLAVQTWPNRAGALVAAVGLAAGLLVRPQVVLLLPAALSAVTERRRDSGSSRSKTIAVAVAWLALVAVLTAAGFLPLVRAGVFDDFVRGVRLVAYGGHYNTHTIGSVAFLLVDELCEYRIIAMLVVVPILGRSSPERAYRSVSTTWLLALAGVLLYAPLSPVTRPYLFHPLWIIWSVNAAVLSALILESGVAPKWQFISVLLVLGMGTTARPRQCRPGPFRQTFAAIRAGREPEEPPLGYRHPYGGNWVLPPWKDYCDLLHYLRTKTNRETRVACLMQGVAVTGPTARLPALPAESATWLFVVKLDDEPRFARVLEQTPDSVVVWAPGQTGERSIKDLPRLEAVVRRLYQPEARFGAIEVWRRRP